MSTGTNKERLEQNNSLLEDIKTQIQNLPEAGGARSNIKIFSSKEAMDTDADKQPGDIAILYDYTEIPVTSEMVINGFILPKELPISLITSSDQQLFTGGYNGGDILKINSDNTITLNIESFDGAGGST